MSLLSLRFESHFINVLVQNGYCDTLSALLRDINIPESADDVAELFLTQHQKIDIDRAIIILDELSASSSITNIRNKLIPLNKLSDHQIINSGRVYNCIDAYNRGYRIISPYAYGRYTASNSASSINNAYNNGLYASYAIFEDRHDDIAQHILDDVREAFGPLIKSITSCKNIEVMYVYSYNYTNNDDTKLLLSAPNIHTLQISQCNELDNNAIKKFLVQFTELRTLRVSAMDLSSVIQLPSTLRELSATSAKLNNYEIARCVRLKILNAYNNPNITTCEPFADTLKKLIAERSGITDDGLKMCSRLKILDASDNSNITTCDPFAKTLKKLLARNKCGIADDGLTMCNRLKVLAANNNPNITTCVPFGHTLIELHAEGSCGITNDGVKTCKHIRKLYADNNPKITTCKPFEHTLIILHADGSCGIDEISSCTNIRILHALNNQKLPLHDRYR